MKKLRPIIKNGKVVREAVREVTKQVKVNKPVAVKGKTKNVADNWSNLFGKKR